jgi:hypothetical protein
LRIKKEERRKRIGRLKKKKNVFGWSGKSKKIEKRSGKGKIEGTKRTRDAARRKLR